jgi:hypothetical protein
MKPLVRGRANVRKRGNAPIAIGDGDKVKK